MNLHWTAEMEAKLERLSSADLLFVLARFLDAQKHIDNEVIREMISQVEHELRRRRVPVGAEPETMHGPAPKPEPPAQAELAAKRRELNARGKGIEEYRLLGELGVDGDMLVWAEQHATAMVTRSDWGPRGYRASERRCSMDVAADAGLLVVEVEKSIGRGRSAPTYRAGVTDAREPDGVLWETQDECPVKHVGIKKRNGGFVHVIEVDGVRREYTSG